MQNNIETTEEYWDCECEFPPHNYIWPKSIKKCDRCGAVPEEQPDSRANEVKQKYKDCFHNHTNP